VIAVAAAGLLLVPRASAAPGPAVQAAGTITAVESGAVIIATTTGQTRAAVTADTVVIRRKAAALSDIKPNDFVGVTARREADGSLTALAINIFPPEFRDRVREAQFMMESGNVMTNATVFQNVRRIEGRTLYLKLGDGSVIITVPKETEVTKLTVGTLADLKPGMRALVRGTTGSDGGLVAATITVDAP